MSLIDFIVTCIHSLLETLFSLQLHEDVSPWKIFLKLIHIRRHAYLHKHGERNWY